MAYEFSDNKNDDSKKKTKKPSGEAPAVNSTPPEIVARHIGDEVVRHIDARKPLAAPEKNEKPEEPKRPEAVPVADNAKTIEQAPANTFEDDSETGISRNEAGLALRAIVQNHLEQVLPRSEESPAASVPEATPEEAATAAQRTFLEQVDAALAAQAAEGEAAEPAEAVLDRVAAGMTSAEAEPKKDADPAEATVDPRNPQAQQSAAPFTALPRATPQPASAGGAGPLPGGGGAAGAVPPMPPVAFANWQPNMPNIAPNIAPNVAPLPVAVQTGGNTVNVVNGVASGLLVGGIVGYLLGRRRGRIRTENRLLPMQKKLERQVQNLEGHLIAREAEVRAFAAKEAIAAQVAARAPKAEVVAAVAAPAPRAAERSAGEAPKPVIEAARPVEQTPRPLAAKPETKPRLPPSAEHLSFSDVRRISETIVVGSTTVNKVYESKLISEEGLRRIVDSHLSGEDIRPVLTEELLLKEIRMPKDNDARFETDPLLRNTKEHVHDKGGQQAVQEAAAAPAADAAPFSFPATPAPPQNAVPSRTALERLTSSATPSNLIVANMVALGVLAALLVVFLIIWLMR